ncbi:hypothetical protein QA612_21395 [Evansella sp. AB-P1]|uniref:hypothetical protein n=1 Tax=Evansella sp. AB-P1 TaxID=3037653 RepID=UPI00241C8995|nr:hypothetical protein [Evansella sp. AB-P1]MDG5790015.1 hypothetical protein [Evansella sp. AB-P1]
MTSAEIINDAGEVEDTRLSLFYLPQQEINAAMKTDQESYSSNEATLKVENAGPSSLFFGHHYKI